MRAFLLAFLSILVIVSAARDDSRESDESGESSSFSYDGYGPSRWPGVCTTGKKQSPINIPVDYWRLDGAQKGRVYLNRQYWQNQNFILKNTGHSIQAALRADLTSTGVMQGDILPKRYVFSQLHFHWGKENNQGSEHTLNGKTYAMEGHFVHYSSEYKSLDAAVQSNKPDALAVVGMFYNVTNKDNPRLTPIIDAIGKLKKTTGGSVQGSGLNLRKLLPLDTSYVFQYYGSLTTPGCNEVVFWNVLGEHDTISQRQINEFRSVIDDHGHRMQDNNRPLASLNKRNIVYTNTKFFNE